jgi:cytoskeletal protein CcmA (bactofilin family)
MAMFSKDDHATRGGKGGSENTLSIVSAGSTVTGDIDCAGVLKVEGRVDGSVTRARQLMLAKQATITGDVTAHEVVVGGQIEGNVLAMERLELQSTAIVNGDITTKSIVVMEGARINGSVRMTELSPVSTSGNAQPAQAAGTRER